jgi:hypothetical protein
VRRIIYASLSSRAMSLEQLEDLLVWARLLNRADEITGLLLYFPPDVAREASFLQFLEGPDDAVEATYERILRDDRHHDIRLVARTDGQERLFPDWTMGLEYVTREDLAHAVPGLDGDGMVVMAELVDDPEAAERLLRRHCAVSDPNPVTSCG